MAKRFRNEIVEILKQVPLPVIFKLWMMSGVRFHLLFRFARSIPVDHFWGEVSALKDGSGNVKFPTISFL